MSAKQEIKEALRTISALEDDLILAREKAQAALGRIGDDSDGDAKPAGEQSTITECDDHDDCFIKGDRHFQDRGSMDIDCNHGSFEHADDCSCYEEYTHNDDIDNTCRADNFEHDDRCHCYDDYHHYDDCNHDDCRDGYFTQEEVDEKLKEKDERIQQLQDEVSKLLGGVGA